MRIISSGEPPNQEFPDWKRYEGGGAFFAVINQLIYRLTPVSSDPIRTVQSKLETECVDRNP